MDGSIDDTDWEDVIHAQTKELQARIKALIVDQEAGFIAKVISQSGSEPRILREFLQEHVAKQRENIINAVETFSKQNVELVLDVISDMKESHAEKYENIENSCQEKLQESREAWQLMMQDEIAKQRSLILSEMHDSIRSNFDKQVDKMSHDLEFWKNECDLVRVKLENLVEELDPENILKEIRFEAENFFIEPEEPTEGGEPKHDEQERIKKKFDTLEDQIRHLEAELSMRTADLLSSAKKNRHLAREYVHLEDAYNTQTREIESLAAELEEKNKEAIMLREKDEVLSSTNRVLMEQVGELETRLQEKEIARRQLQSKVHRLQDLLRERERMVDTIQQQTRDALSNVQDRVQASQRILHEKERVIEDLESAMRILRAEMYNKEDIYNSIFGRRPRSVAASELQVATSATIHHPVAYQCPKCGALMDAHSTDDKKKTTTPHPHPPSGPPPHSSRPSSSSLSTQLPTTTASAAGTRFEGRSSRTGFSRPSSSGMVSTSSHSSSSMVPPLPIDELGRRSEDLKEFTRHASASLEGRSHVDARAPRPASSRPATFRLSEEKKEGESHQPIRPMSSRTSRPATDRGMGSSWRSSISQGTPLRGFRELLKSRIHRSTESARRL
eukprot:TRINITY_DN8017_c0_g1_i1.p1 TRINITY_DN8017_c0_g1~~TRINITY_DN8017_c0_g1_i1.p1  ORF type:complete len:618 (+),score=163.04 TRINITY_DN8017_c0_g1_i1:49-1902(+)